MLSDQELDLIKYFISSDSALTQLENSFLRKCLAPGLKILPAVMKNLKEIIEKKLNEAEFINLISDGWTALFSNEEYLGLCAQTINSSWEQELIVIGMVELKNGHSAEQLKLNIEYLVNQYNFDKNKVLGK